MPYKLFLPSLPLYAEFMYKHKALCKQISFGLVGVEAFVEGAGKVLGQERLELLTWGNRGVAGQWECACDTVTQRPRHRRQVCVLDKNNY